jgi:hypothetical protein
MCRVRGRTPPPPNRPDNLDKCLEPLLKKYPPKGPLEVD